MLSVMDNCAEALAITLADVTDPWDQSALNCRPVRNEVLVSVVTVVDPVQVMELLTACARPAAMARSAAAFPAGLAVALIEPVGTAWSSEAGVMAVSTVVPLACTLAARPM
jgi:hypothetical protein